MRPFLRRSPLLPGESLPSLFARLIGLNYYDGAADINSICRRVSGLPFNVDLFHYTRLEALPALAALADLPWRDLLAASEYRFANALHLYGPTQPATLPDGAQIAFLNGRGRVGHIRPFDDAQFCPDCLREGVYHRLVWSPAASAICLTHNILLVDQCLNCRALDEFSKAFLLAWAAWHLFTDAVRRRAPGRGPDVMQIVFEEANKILSGVDYGGDEDGGGAAYTAEQFAAMWRDSRKYGIWLHLITQSPALIPPGILSSCNNLFTAQLKNPRDRDAVVAALARSEKGFVDETWRRFLARLPVARAVVKLGYSPDAALLEPVLLQPDLVPVREPTDAEVAARLGSMT